MSLKRHIALSTMMSLALSGQNDWSSHNAGKYNPYRNNLPEPKTIFSDEELENLASLSGKSKKKYVKELKLKYEDKK